MDGAGGTLLAWAGRGTKQIEPVAKTPLAALVSQVGWNRHHENRARRMAENVMGNAADQELIRRAVAARAQNDDIGTKLLAFGDDPLGGIALDKQRRCDLSAPAQDFGVALQQLMLGVEALAHVLANAVRSGLPTDERWIRLGNVDEPQPAGAGARYPRRRLDHRTGSR